MEKALLNAMGTFPYAIGVSLFCYANSLEKKDTVSAQRAVVAGVVAAIVEECLSAAGNAFVESQGKTASISKACEEVAYMALPVGILWLGEFVAKRINPEYTWKQSVARIGIHSLIQMSVVGLIPALRDGSFDRTAG